MTKTKRLNPEDRTRSSFQKKINKIKEEKESILRKERNRREQAKKDYNDKKELKRKIDEFYNDFVLGSYCSKDLVFFKKKWKEYFK